MSTFFEWGKDFETGNKKIDDQHYSLVQLINEFMKIELTGQEEAYDEILLIGNKLAEYVKIHFASEEELMETYLIDPRHVIKHKKIHNDFIKKIDEFTSEKLWYTKSDKLEEIIEFLIRWLAYHILNTDKSLFRQIDYVKNSHMKPEESYDIEAKREESMAEPLLKALKALYSLVYEKNRELEEKKKNLEEVVKERTADLVILNKKLKNLSLVDDLTGLYNRRFAVAEIEQLIYNWERYQTPFSLVYLDVDKFKEVNDIFGHEKGDMILKWIGNYLKKSVRKTDKVCRIGGDEFIIICTHYNAMNTKKIAEKLIQGYQVENKEISEVKKYWKPSLSVGVAIVDKSIHEVDDILMKADGEMYKAKQAGGNSLSCDIEEFY